MKDAVIPEAADTVALHGLECSLTVDFVVLEVAFEGLAI